MFKKLFSSKKLSETEKMVSEIISNNNGLSVSEIAAIIGWTNNAVAAALNGIMVKRGNRSTRIIARV